MENVKFLTNNMCNTYVLKRLAKNQPYSQAPARIQELHSDNPNTGNILSLIRNLWNNGEFTQMITASKPDANRHIFAITSPKEDIQAPDIYGLVDLGIKDKKVKIHYLQANPKYLEGENEGDVHSIGRSLLNGLCECFKNLGLEEMNLFSRPGEKGFYKKVFPNIVEKASTENDVTNLSILLTDKPQKAEKGYFKEMYF